MRFWNTRWWLPIRSREKGGTDMHTERNKRLAREWYELIGSARYEEAKAYVSDDFEKITRNRRKK